MEHFITEVRINEVRHLKNITIKLNPEKRQHLILTGKNGSGKTSVLQAMRSYLHVINNGELTDLKANYYNWLSRDKKEYETAKTDDERLIIQKRMKSDRARIEQYDRGVTLDFKNELYIDTLYANGDFITAFFSAERDSQVERVNGARNVILAQHYGINETPSKILLKYMVHLKTQQAYAKNEGELNVEKKIKVWFERFENALKVLLDDASIKLIYDYKNYNSNLIVEGAGLRGEDYCKSLQATRINLCFLRKINFDQQTTRSVEIPACGGFMMAERTAEHLAMFEEGKEAAFFSNNEELLDKCSYYLAHEQERAVIAELGLKRCIASDYSNRGMIRNILKAIYGS